MLHVATILSFALRLAPSGLWQMSYYSITFGLLDHGSAAVERMWLQLHHLRLQVLRAPVLCASVHDRIAQLLLELRDALLELRYFESERLSFLRAALALCAPTQAAASFRQAVGLKEHGISYGCGSTVVGTAVNYE